MGIDHFFQIVFKYPEIGLPQDGLKGYSIDPFPQHIFQRPGYISSFERIFSKVEKTQKR
jgi:hypothetical protein